MRKNKPLPVWKRHNKKQESYSSIIDFKIELKEYRLLCKSKSTRFAYYSDWKRYILQKIQKLDSVETLENFRRFCKNRSNPINEGNNLYVEICLLLVSTFLSSIVAFTIEKQIDEYTEDGMMILIFLTIMLTTFIVSNQVFKSKSEYQFYEDIIEIVTEKLDEIKNKE